MSNARQVEVLEKRFAMTSVAPTTSPVTVTSASGGITILAANTLRKHAVIQNNGTQPCILRYGGDPSTTDYNFTLSKVTAARDGLGGSIKVDNYQGEIKGITESSSTIISVIEILD